MALSERNQREGLALVTYARRRMASRANPIDQQKHWLCQQMLCFVLSIYSAPVKQDGFWTIFYVLPFLVSAVLKLYLVSEAASRECASQ